MATSTTATERESEGDWETAARVALSANQGTDEVEVLARRRPPLLDPEGISAVMAPMLAAVTWAAAVLRDQMADTPLDPIGLLLRLIALALTVRAIILGITLVRRIRIWLATPRYGLALTDDGLLLRRPEGELALRRADVVDVRERGDWRRRAGGRRWSEVYLLVRLEQAPGALPFVAIPPVLARTPGVLAERLMRWRGPVDVPEEPSWPDPEPLASKVYARAAAGQTPPGGAVIRHGKGWLARGPYATLLLSAAILEGFARLPEQAWAVIGPVYPIALAACLALVPAGWLVMTRRHVGPRKGLALVMTRSEVMMRTREGILRAQWRNLRRAYVEAKSGWSLVEGYHLARKLVLEREGAPTIRYDEAFLGIPAEVAQALCEAYKKGTLPGLHR